MKQLLFLLLFPCLALAQYTGNAGQKITLGEQTTADGLVYRGVAADTTRKPIVDTMAYILLDTNTNIIWQYKKATSNAWLKVNLTRADTTLFNYVNTYGTQTVNGEKTFTSAVTATKFKPNGNDSTGTGMYLPATNTLGFSTNGAKRLEISSTGTSTFTINSGVYTALNATSPNTSVYYRLTPTGGDAYLFGAGVQQTDDFGIYNLTRDKQYLTILGGASGGKVGIGVNTPGSNLQVGTLNNTTNEVLRIGISYSVANEERGILSWHDNAGITGKIFSTFNGNDMTKMHFGGLYNNAYNQGINLTIQGNGNVGIGTTSPAVQLHTTGAVRFATFAGGGTTTLDVDNTGNLARTSSIELKKDVTPINYGLNQILQINPINFNWINEDKYGNENENGFIAEDVMNVIPNVVGSDAHGLFMDYTKLIPILTKAIQEQNVLIKALEQRILILENK